MENTPGYTPREQPRHLAVQTLRQQLGLLPTYPAASSRLYVQGRNAPFPVPAMCFPSRGKPCQLTNNGKTDTRASYTPSPVSVILPRDLVRQYRFIRIQNSVVLSEEGRYLQGQWQVSFLLGRDSSLVGLLRHPLKRKCRSTPIEHCSLCSWHVRDTAKIWQIDPCRV